MTFRLEIVVENESDIKDAFKKSVLEALDEREVWFGNLFREITGDIALANSIEDGEKTRKISNAKVTREHITDITLPISDYAAFYDVIIGQATKSGLKLAIEHLHMPKEALNFFHFVLKGLGSNWRSELTITDEKLAEKVGKSTKTIQRGRKEIETYMKSGGKAVIDISPAYAESGEDHIGHTYSLNLVYAIENGIRKFMEHEENYLPFISEFIMTAETVKLSEVPKHNPAKQIFLFIKKEISILSDKPIIIDTLAVLMRRLQASSK